MALVLTLGGFEFQMNKYHRPPPHVFAFGEGGVARVALGSTEEDVHVIRSSGMEAWEKARLEMIVRANHSRLLRHWEELHGSQD